MKLKNLLIILIIAAILLTVILAFFILKPDKNCGDGICGDLENLKTCPEDCEKPVGYCKEGEKRSFECPDGDFVKWCKCIGEKWKCIESPEALCKEKPGNGGNGGTPASGESRFGIHVGRLDLKSEISELGDIYSRINLGPDAFGWKITKQNSIALCQACCIEPGCASECETGYLYYCEPENREEGIVGKDIADVFYADNHEILFAVSPGSYGENEPKNVEDLLSLDYPANEQIYKDFIEYLMQRYPDVEYWEVGNEADNPQFWGDTAANYVRLFTLTSNEIKNYCPDCKVGISLVGPYSPDEWFNAITGICNTIDFLDLHQYHSETMDELKEFEDNDLTRWKNSCPGVEIISTETGVPSEPITFKGNTWELGTSEIAQAQDSIKYLTMMFNAGYSKIYYYLFDHDYIPGMDEIFEHNGLLNEDNSKKDVFETYELMIDKVDYFTSVSKLTDGQYKYSFANKDPVYVLWCDFGTCTLDSSIPTTNIRITDYQGNQLTEISLTESPVFVEIK